MIWLKYLQPKDELTPDELEHGLKWVVRDGMASQLMGVLTGSVFLVALAVALGASNSAIGLLAAIPPLVQLLQIPAVAVVEKIRNRRLIVVIGSGLARLAWLIV